ncbi:MAG: hypothetical protein WBV39_16645 [Rudaea sp.]
MVDALRETPERRWSKRALLLVLTLITLFGSFGVSADERDQAKRIHDRIAGVPPDATTLDTMAADINGANGMTAIDAAMLATKNPAFYNVTLKNFVAPWTNRDQSVFVPLNDYIATVIGMIRDDVDFREVLSGDILYTVKGVSPAYSTIDNDHYANAEADAVDLQTNLTPTTQSSLTGVPPNATAGVLTTRAASKAFFINGTNRAMFRFTMINFMCRDMEQVHDTSRAPDRIRQDVSRSPGGDSRVFLNNCIGCHSGMDPMAQAFAYYNFQYDKDADPDANAGSLKYNDTNDVDPVTTTRVVAKYHNNAATFPYGYITMDDHWDNYWRAGPNAALGWDSSLPGSGEGAKSLGEEFANSDAFAECQVKKVFKNVCLREPQDTNDRNQITAMVSDFKTGGYKLRRVFAESAVYCSNGN